MIETSRHHDIFDPNGFHLPVHIVGCGGMGSHIATGLVRMGVGARTAIHLYDFDDYEPHNLANQAIDEDSVGQPKVIGLEQQLRYIEKNLNIFVHEEEVRGKAEFDGVVFLCLDKMEARKDIVEWCLEGRRDVKCVIETRMDAETGISHCFNPNNPQHMDCWWMYWYPDEHTENTPGCGGQRSVISAVYGTTGLALKQFELFARKKSRRHMYNRVYRDFNFPDNGSTESWAPSWHP